MVIVKELCLQFSEGDSSLGRAMYPNALIFL